MKKNKRVNFSGICTCGHSWGDHHHSCILNLKALKENNQEFRNVDGLLGDECERTQMKGMRIRTDEPECNCDIYWDINWPKRSK
jgi:hypothetical protein